MSAYWVFALLVGGSYLLGAVPWGLLIGRWSRGVDVRNTGSGNIGSSNVLRTAGARAAAAALLLDIAKGAVPVLAAILAADAASLSPAQSGALAASAAMAALVGHSWSPYLKFQGGKGVATGFGGLVVLYPPAGLIALLIGLVLMRTTRYISLGSIVGVTFGGAALVAGWAAGELPAAYAVHGAAAAAIIVVRHRANVRRLMSGTEAKLGDPAPAPGTQVEG